MRRSGRPPGCRRRSRQRGKLCGRMEPRRWTVRSFACCNLAWELAVRGRRAALARVKAEEVALAS